MSQRNFRRSNLISPFGPGAISVTTDGASLMTAGLDAWPNNRTPNIQLNEFQFGEWRLEKQLQVDYFISPPDFRTPISSTYSRENDQANMNLTIPVLRFPTWFHCTNQSCGRLVKRSLTTSDVPRCTDCKTKSIMTQVQFIALCDQGHIQDFPWNEWVHRSASPLCTGKLRLKGSGSSSLSGRRVTCDLCDSQRSLGSILVGEVGSNEEGGKSGLSFLSKNLDNSKEPFKCQGHRPWLGGDTGSTCSSSLRGSLRGATNVYYPIMRTAVYVPSEEENVPDELIRVLELGIVRGTLSLLKQSTSSIDSNLVSHLRRFHQEQFRGFTDEQMLAAVQFLDQGPTEAKESESDTEETSFRRLEFKTLRQSVSHKNLQVKKGDISTYDNETQEFLSTLNRIERLTETRVFNGFSRVSARDGLSNKDRDELIWQEKPNFGYRWLPAYQVHGEGLYFELDEMKLRSWEQRPEVIARASNLNKRVAEQRQARSLEEKAITPRFLLIHTLAHVLINQMVFYSGYSSASLRERLYVSNDENSPMAGFLIYTASGDSDGTLGGLVRLGVPETIGTLLKEAVRSASWCSGDPVCMELGASGGQGPDSCNLAACHACSLLPETSCEEFNHYLDRWTLVGDVNNPESGFFASMLDG